MTFPSPSAPPPDRAVDEVEADSDPSRHVLTPIEVRADPILYKLAKHQGAVTTPAKPGPTAFKARPAPANMGDSNAGPKMTKSAALRQGLAWEDKSKRARPATADGSTVKAFGDVPGHKRNNLSVDIKSLKAPMVMPRGTRSSQLRTGQGGGVVPAATVRRTPEEVLADVKAQKEQEKLRRRASIAMPASLSAPQIAPRTNRSSELRTGGGGSKAPPSSSRAQTALTATTAGNVDRPSVVAAAANEKAARRASVIGTVKSLGAPSIVSRIAVGQGRLADPQQPRLNKAAMLRNPDPPTSTAAATAAPSSSTTTTRPNFTSATSSHSISARSGPSTAPIIPRATKSSLLRANLGAKIQTR